ncbi:4-hydroxyphenylacetate 3-monooxygenase [Leucobacter exalbidus]|uniref:4-hydroxyphenylacetate 3-monooxygenase n=1 Tax=Leucobacter exalbidus TaxID=662960 RepID=A0A940PXJ4_9MICO|nr:4-hydroxyphenylacetate 3-monooxygenase, oxygenase component [Leucobacter exalbidus]MBP1326946.1 4-hydroxyphenylacetate 3-monooxygenase [Leucobacter exalbidus]
MSIRTGQQYLDRLNERTGQIYLDGELISTNIAEHPKLAPGARAFAKLYDMQHDPAHRDVLTFESPTSGERVSTSFLVPRTEADLVQRREAMALVARSSHGFLGRTGDYMNSALAALSSAKTFFEQADPVFGERIERYTEYVRENDLLTAHALITPQANRAETGSQPMGDSRIAARIVEEREDGIVVRGARMLATNAPIADELLVFPSTVLRGAPQDAPYSYAFAVPSDAPGLKYYCRAPLHAGAGSLDEPLASRFEELDAFVVFDDVFVPNDRIFMLGNPRLRNEWYSATGAGALMTHQVVCRTLAKTEFYLGLAAELADAIGIEDFQHIQEDLGELITYVELERALLRASETEGEVSADGVYLPKWSTLNAARNWYPKSVSQRLPEIIRKFSASGLMALPSEADLDNPDERADLDRYLQGARVDAQSRIRLFKLALDASVSGFAGRESLYEYYFFGDPVRMKTALVKGYDFGVVRERVRELLV